MARCGGLPRSARAYHIRGGHVGLRLGFDKLDTEKYETSTFEISEGFSSISISADTADVLLALSDDDTCRVVCYERDGVEHSADVRDDTLVVDTVDDPGSGMNISA